MDQPARPSNRAHDARLYRGGCHCGAVHYEVALDLSRPTEGSGTVWEHRVAPAGFKLLIGDESLAGYQFSAESVHHFFCVRCGTRVFAHHLRDDTGDLYAVDVRNLHSRRAPVRGWLHVGTKQASRAS